MTAAAEAAPRARVVLIDLSALFWSAWHSSAEEAASQARVRTLDAVKRCSAPGELVAVCCDSGKSFRKAISPDYKANRPERDHAAIDELRRAKERLRADAYLLWEADGFEADDVIASAVGLAHERGHEVRIASADKDLLQLLGPGVDCLRTHTWKVVGDKEVREQFGVEPHQLGDWLALVGDKSDNIAGCPGVGPKTATALLAKHGTLAGLWDALDAASLGGRVMTPAIDANLRKSVIAVEQARKLVALRVDVPIAFDDIYATRTPQRLSEEEIDMSDEAAPEPIERETTPPPQAAPQRIEAPPRATDVAVEAKLDNGASVALVPAEYARQLEPNSMGTAYKLAKALAESRLYQRFPNAEAIFAVVLRGREMGVGALTALDSFHVIEGKPSPSAYFIIARAKAHPDCEYFMCTETTTASSTWETKNRCNPKSSKLTYTIEDAQAAGLLSRGGNWKARPAEMLRKTAGVQLARMEYPEAALGLYAVEELEGNGG
jgi:5'-3' exonuclease